MQTLEVKLSKAQLEGMTSGDLVTLYNKYAETPVKKFSDKATAVKRTMSVLPKAEKPKKEKAPKGERVRRGMYFNFIATGEPKKVVQDTKDRPVLRARLLEGLRQGITFDEAIDIVKKFDADRIELRKIKKDSAQLEHQLIRAYEGLRHIHYYANYSMQHVNKDDPFSKIKLVPNRKA